MYPSREQVRKTLYLIWKDKKMPLEQVPAVQKGISLNADYIDFVLDNGTQEMCLDIEKKQVAKKADADALEEAIQKWKGGYDE